MRYPKGWFALTTVYSFTGLAILASIIFSLLLFLSIDDNPLMKWLFGGLAIIFELGKFYVWYEYGERKARRDLSGAFWSLLFYSVLAAISIGGSIGGINSATNTVLSQQARHERELARFDEQIASIERQIQLNEEAARKYIELERISSGVSSLQHANTKLRLQQDEHQSGAVPAGLLPLGAARRVRRLLRQPDRRGEPLSPDVALAAGASSQRGAGSVGDGSPA